MIRQYRATMSDERYISGIYNYCDYWCERCAFTKRCRNFRTDRELEREMGEKAPVDDATQEAFWGQLADQLRDATVFSSAGDWGDDMADDGFDYEPDPEFEAHQGKLRSAVNEHPLTELANTYMKKAHAWLESSDNDLKAVAQELLTAAKSPFAETVYEEQARRIGEMLEVIGWYHTLLPPKTARAVRSMIEAQEKEREDGELANILFESRMGDANGSGKLTLESIKRSAAAWVEMRQIVPRREDEILEMLAILSRLQRGIHEYVPGAKSFVRPGLDEE